ncbi:MAG: FeoA family protein [Candidatus Aminicenantia bacterium]
MNLLEAENRRIYRITGIFGGRRFRTRLMTIGLHLGDLIEKQTEGLGGPVLVKNISLYTKIAIGRGMAMKIIVEPVESMVNNEK